MSAYLRSIEGVTVKVWSLGSDLLIVNLERLTVVEPTADEEEEEEEGLESVEVVFVDLDVEWRLVWGCTAGDDLILDDCTGPVSVKLTFPATADDDEVVAVGVALEEEEEDEDNCVEGAVNDKDDGGCCDSGFSILSVSLTMSSSVFCIVCLIGDADFISLTWLVTEVVLEEGYGLKV